MDKYEYIVNLAEKTAKKGFTEPGILDEVPDLRCTDL